MTTLNNNATLVISSAAKLSVKLSENSAKIFAMFANLSLLSSGDKISVTLESLRSKASDMAPASVTSNIGVLKKNNLIENAEDKCYNITDLGWEILENAVELVEDTTISTENSTSTKPSLSDTILKAHSDSKKVAPTPPKKSEPQAPKEVKPAYIVPSEISDEVDSVIDALGLKVKEFQVMKTYQLIRFFKNDGILEFNVYESKTRILFKGKKEEDTRTLVTNLFESSDILDQKNKSTYSFLTIQTNVINKLLGLNYLDLKKMIPVVEVSSDETSSDNSEEVTTEA